jgi:hypothetical protein
MKQQLPVGGVSFQIVISGLNVKMTHANIPQMTTF